MRPNYLRIVLRAFLAVILSAIILIAVFDTIGIKPRTDDVLASLLAFALLVVALAVYSVPAVVAYSREHPNANAIAVLTLLLGWTFLGWVAALVWASTAIAPQRKL